MGDRNGADKELLQQVLTERLLPPQLTPEQQLRRLLELADLAQTASNHLRRLASELFGAQTQSEGEFHAQLAGLCEALGADGTVVLEAPTSAYAVTVPSEVARVLFQTIRELVTDVFDSAGSSMVSISSRLCDDGAVAIRLLGEDIDADAPSGNGFAGAGAGACLAAIRRRLDDCQVSLEVESLAGTAALCATILVPKRVLAGH